MLLSWPRQNEISIIRHVFDFRYDALRVFVLNGGFDDIFEIASRVTSHVAPLKPNNIGPSAEGWFEVEFLLRSQSVLIVLIDLVERAEVAKSNDDSALGTVALDVTSSG